MREKKIDEAELVNQYKLGKTDKEIAKHFGVSQSAVTQARQKLGLESNYTYPVWKEKAPSKINIKLTPDFKLMSKYADFRGKSFTQLYGNGKTYRICYIKQAEGRAVWAELAYIETAKKLTKWLREEASSQTAEQIENRFKELGILI